MGFKASFLDNQKYGASDINGIVSKLTTGGIEDPLIDGQSYNTSKINGVIKAISHSGVVPEGYTSCKVEGINSNTIKILKGTAFFESGACIEIDSAGVELQFVTGKKNYVYLLSDLPNNKVTVECALSKGDGDYVPLAEVEADGTITDKRKYAKGKLPGYQSNTFSPLEVIIDDVIIPAGSESVDRQVFFDAGEYSKMFVNIEGSARVLIDYNIKNDETFFIRRRATSDVTSGDSKRIYLYTSSYVDLYFNFTPNTEGMLFTLEKRSTKESRGFPTFTATFI